jgi:hypothetical protein
VGLVIVVLPLHLILLSWIEHFPDAAVLGVPVAKREIPSPRVPPR